MKSANPVSGCNAVEVCKTLDTSRGLEPSCNQVGIAVTYVGHIDYENNGYTMDQCAGPLLKGSPTGGGRPLPAVAYLPFDTTQITSPANGNNPKYGDPCHPLASGAHAPAVAFHVDAQPDEMNFSTETTATLTKSQHAGVAQSMSVRRLNPTECERLQGFPDGYTNIPGASDEPRYKALGNSMAVNVMQLIGERIQKVRAA